MLPVMAALARMGRPFALVTIHRAEGGARPVGSQMVVTPDRWWGFLSGGCVEADVACHALASLADGRALELAYGQGSPFFDVRLPCGGRIELLVEPFVSTGPVLLDLLASVDRREAARYLSDGARRACVAMDARVPGAWLVDRPYLPPQRLLVVGHDPFALAIAAAGRSQDWSVALLRPHGPSAPPPLDVAYVRAPIAEGLTMLDPDPWTALAIATHDPDLDHEALVAALTSRAGYVGLLGSRRRLASRLARLRAEGFVEADLERLRAPIGLPIAGRAPREVAAAVVAEIIDARGRTIA